MQHNIMYTLGFGCIFIEFERNIIRYFRKDISLE